MKHNLNPGKKALHLWPPQKYRPGSPHLILFLYLGTLFLALILSNCTVELEADLEPEDQVLAAYVWINCGDSVSTAIVEPSVAFDETFNLNQSRLNGPAGLQLFKAGERWAEYRQNGQSSYYSSVHPPVGLGQEEWQLVVSHPDFGEARASGRPPSPGSVLSASLKSEYPRPEGGLAGNALEVKIQDPAGVRNFYEVALLNGPADSSQVVYLTSHFLMATSDTAFFPSNSFTLIDRWLFSDEVGDGDAITVAFSPISSREELEQPWLNIRYVSEPYYQYLKSLSNSGEQILEPLQGAQGSFSNFDNGRFFGVFALYVEERLPVSK